MTMNLYFYTISFLLFYIISPIVALILREQEKKKFRSTLYEISKRDKCCSRIKFDDSPKICWGEVEAIEHGGILWINSNNSSKTAYIPKKSLIILERENDESLVSIKKMSLQDRSILVEGTPILLSGQVTKRKGLPHFSGEKTDPVVAIIDDKKRANLVEELILEHRRLFQPYRSLLLGSFVIGFFVLSALNFVILSSSVFTSIKITAITMTTLPLQILSIPGNILFFPINRLFKKWREIKSKSDLERFLSTQKRQKNNGKFLLLAISLLGLANILINGTLFVAVLRIFIE